MQRVQLLGSGYRVCSECSYWVRGVGFAAMQLLGLGYRVCSECSYWVWGLGFAGMLSGAMLLPT